MGDPISTHDGVRACPAMHVDTEKKYIVKIISVPASQSKLDALLLAGAFSDRTGALTYFKELADDILEEAELLQKLSRHEGFVSFENWQLVPMRGKETGYDIYLLAPYLPTLENVLRHNQMTHLQAINLGLDLCAALSATRRFGYLYGNLRPSNVYLCNEREFRIGDLGFLSLDSLPYASLPDKYHSNYTPPEISDAYSALNDTMDTYALGLILYRAYNDGQLPAADAALEAPRYADADLSEIILRACAVDPAQRWADPVQMGQALATYMQTHTVNDTLIAPPPVVEETPEPEEVTPEEDPQPSTDDILAEVDQALESAPPIIPAESAEDAEEEPTEAEEVPVEEDTTEEVIAEDAAALPEQEEPAVEVTFEDSADVETADAEEFEIEEPVEEEPTVEEPVEEVADSEESIAEVSTEDEPAAQTAEKEETIDETAQILAQADDLIAHQLPDPPVAPDPIEVTLPVAEESPAEEESSEEVPSAEEETADEETDEAESSSDEESDEESAEEETAEVVHHSSHKKKKQNRAKKWGIFAAILAILLLLGSGAGLFYQYIYLQTVYDMTLTGSDDQLTVQLLTNIPDEKLTVRCTDTHGNALVANVKNSTAHFTGLKPATAYKLEVRIDGFHKLLGEITCDYFTTSQTVINGFYAATGPENGSVILSFTPQGPTSPQWSVTYSAEGEESKTVTFTGHMVTLTGLTVGKEYTFKLQPDAQLNVSGTDTITYTVSDLIFAENLQVINYADGNLTLAWKKPDGVTVSKWHIRCYNDSGFDQTLSTENTIILFEGLDMTSAYTVEVTADGMTVGTRFNISTDSIAVSDVKVDSAEPGKLQVTWNYDGTIPEGGWLVLYTIDGSPEQQVIPCSDNACTITSLIPGATYSITIQTASGTTALGGLAQYTAPAASPFNNFNVTASDMEFSMCKTPNKVDWDHNDVTDGNYTTSFKIGESASLVMHLTKKTPKSDDMVTTMYVIRDAQGQFVSAKEETRTWDEMWNNRYGELTIPVMPETAGTYTVEIYFDGASVTVQSFEIL